MTLITAGVDVGSTYTKVVVLDENDVVRGRAMARTGFRLEEVAASTYAAALADAGCSDAEVAYVVATGMGRHQAAIRDIQVTDVTAASRAATVLGPSARTILDIGGQTMKAARVDGSSVLSFRMNDKCAAGTGAFLEKTARYMGFETAEIGPLVATSKDPVPVSGVCAVFAESEVINHLSIGSPPADIMFGAMVSLVGRSIQLMKRVKMEPDYLLLGGILRFPRMVEELCRQLGAPVLAPSPDVVQDAIALGAAVLGRQRVRKLRASGTFERREGRLDAKVLAPS